MDKILVDYYKGSYGPTILFIVNDEDDLYYLFGLIKGLVRYDYPEISLSKNDRFALSNMRNLILKTLEKKKPHEKNLYVSKEEFDSLDFIWALDTEGWYDCLGLLEGLIEGSGSGHQYLTSEGFDDALVVVSYKEHHKIPSFKEVQ